MSFGTDEWEIVAGMILDWVIVQGFGQGRIRSIELSVAAAVTVDLPGRSPIFVKAWAEGQTDKRCPRSLRCSAQRLRTAIPPPPF
jgi:hypothetical protein